MPWPKSSPSATTRGAVVLLFLFAAWLALAGPAQAFQRVVFTDRTFLQVEDAWADDRYVHFVYHGRPITVLRSDVARIEGTRPRVRPHGTPACLPPQPGDDDQAVRRHFRCLGVQWTRAPVVENGRPLWIYEGRVADRLERYVVKDGRLLEIVTPGNPSPAP